MKKLLIISLLFLASIGYGQNKGDAYIWTGSRAGWGPKLDSVKNAAGTKTPLYKTGSRNTIKRMYGSGGTTITDHGDSVEINGSGSGGDSTFWFSATGFSYFTDSARLAAGTNVTLSQSGHVVTINAIVGDSVGSGIFGTFSGDGRDSDLTTSGNSQLSADRFQDSLRGRGGDTLWVNGYRLFAKAILRVSGTGWFVIGDTGRRGVAGGDGTTHNGTSSSGGAAGTAVTGRADGYLKQYGNTSLSNAGGAGIGTSCACSKSNGNGGGSGNSSFSDFLSLGTSSASGGEGGYTSSNPSGNEGGTSPAAPSNALAADFRGNFDFVHLYLGVRATTLSGLIALSPTNVSTGAGGGGFGDGSSGAGIGHGGSGGGASPGESAREVWVAADYIGDSVKFIAIGGPGKNGGNGGDGRHDGSGAGGGGGGGSDGGPGGPLFTFYHWMAASVTADLSGGTPGTGGLGGTSYVGGVPGGTNGSPGLDGDQGPSGTWWKVRY